MGESLTSPTMSARFSLLSRPLFCGGVAGELWKHQLDGGWFIEAEEELKKLSKVGLGGDGGEWRVEGEVWQE